MKIPFSNKHRALLIRRSFLIGAVVSTLVLSILVGMFSIPLPTSLARNDRSVPIIAGSIVPKIVTIPGESFGPLPPDNIEQNVTPEATPDDPNQDDPAGDGAEQACKDK